MSDFDDIEKLLEALIVQGRLGCDYRLDSATDAASFLVQVRSRACSGVNHPTQGPFWGSTQQRLDVMSRLLNDKATRQRLGESVQLARARERERRMERLWQAVEMIHASGATSITLTTRELISSAYVKTSMGLLEDDDLVKALARRRISCRPEPIGMQNAGLPDSDMVRLENELRVFFTDNIYSFIGLPLGAPLEISRRKTAEKKAEWGPRKAGHLKACAQSIISHAEEYFVSEALRSRYDFSYVRRRLEEEGLLTNLTLAGIDGVLDENEWRHLVNNGVQLGYPRNQVELVVEASAKLKGVHIAAKPK